MARIIFLISIFLSGNLQAQPTYNVKNFGARGNGITDDTRAIQKAINKAAQAKNATVYFPAGTYLISSYTTTPNYLENYCLLLKPFIKIKGVGSKSKIKIANGLFSSPDSNANAHLFLGRNINDVSFSNLYIDMNGVNNLVPEKVIKNGAAIFAYGGSNIHIQNLTIKNCSGTNMVNIMSRGSGLSIKNSQFINGGNYVGSKTKLNIHQYDFSFLYSEWENTTIDRCIMKQENVSLALQDYTGAVELHGSNSSLTNSTITGCFPAVYITSSNPGVLNNVIVRNNKMLQCTDGISFWLVNPMRNININNNVIQLARPRFPLAMNYAIKIPNGNAAEYNAINANASFIHGLKIENNTIKADSMNVLSGGIMLHSVSNGYIAQNKIQGVNHAGIAMLGSKFGCDSILFFQNSFSQFRPNPVKESVPGYIVITDTYSTGKKDAPGFKNIVFENNNAISNSTNAKTMAKFKSAFIALPQHQQKEIKLINNQFNLPQQSEARVIAP